MNSMLTWVADNCAWLIPILLGVVTLVVVWKQLALQTVATIISWVQDEKVRESRRILYGLEGVLYDQWTEDWKQAADRASQAFNSAGLLLRGDLVVRFLSRRWWRATRPLVRRTWVIVKLRVEERQKQEPNVFKEFEWLAKGAGTAGSRACKSSPASLGIQ